MTNPTSWKEYWSELATVYEQLAGIALKAKNATGEEQEKLWQRYQKPAPAEQLSTAHPTAEG